MKYSSASEKAAIVPRKMVRTFVASDAEIPKIKRKLVISVSIELFVMMIYLTLQVVTLICRDITNENIRSGIFVESFITIISMLYLIVFIIVLTQYFPRKLLIFAWLTLIQLIGGAALLILAIMGIIISLSLIDTVRTEIVVDLVFAMIGIAIIVLSVLNILYSLNLLKMVKF